MTFIKDELQETASEIYSIIIGSEIIKISSYKESVSDRSPQASNSAYWEKIKNKEPGNVKRDLENLQND